MSQWVSDIRYTFPETENVLILMDKGYDMNQIAEMLGISYTTVYGRLWRAKKTFGLETIEDLLLYYRYYR